MIIESIFSTLDSSGQANFAPMGVIWGEAKIIVRPFLQTRTYENLLATGFGVVNFTDNVRAYVQCGLYDAVLPNFPALKVPGVVYQDVCYWRELQVVSHTENTERAEVHCQVVEKGWQRDFLGFSRARSAVIEAAILATRLHFYDHEWIAGMLEHYGQIIEKTGGETESLAFQEVRTYVGRWKRESRG